MNYVESLNLFGVEAKEIPCVLGNGAPTSATVGAVGLFYMDTSSQTKDVYKCIGAAGGVYTWARLEYDDTEVKQLIGNIETALDAIIAIQEELIHGKTIMFEIVGLSACTAKEGMTWGEWIESEHNGIGCYVDDTLIPDCPIWCGFGILYAEGTNVHLNDVIIADYNYVY